MSKPGPKNRDSCIGYRGFQLYKCKSPSIKLANFKLYSLFLLHSKHLSFVILNSSLRQNIFLDAEIVKIQFPKRRC